MIDNRRNLKNLSTCAQILRAMLGSYTNLISESCLSFLEQFVRFVNNQPFHTENINTRVYKVDQVKEKALYFLCPSAHLDKFTLGGSCFKRWISRFGVVTRMSAEKIYRLGVLNVLPDTKAPDVHVPRPFLSSTGHEQERTKPETQSPWLCLPNFREDLGPNFFTADPDCSMRNILKPRFSDNRLNSRYVWNAKGRKLAHSLRLPTQKAHWSVILQFGEGHPQSKVLMKHTQDILDFCIPANTFLCVRVMTHLACFEKKKKICACRFPFAPTLTWVASSRVGDRITARKPCFRGSLRWCSTGKMNAAVLPEPVGAHASISRFCKHTRQKMFVIKVHHKNTITFCWKKRHQRDAFWRRPIRSPAASQAQPASELEWVHWIQLAAGSLRSVDASCSLCAVVQMSSPVPAHPTHARGCDACGEGGWSATFNVM